MSAIPKFVTVQLSNKQWEALAHVIDRDNKALIDDTKTRVKFDTVINVYLWSTFNDRQGVQPAELKKPFKKLKKLSSNLISFFEDYCFDTSIQYSDQLCIDIMKHREVRSKQQFERPLIEDNLIIKKNDLDFNNAYRNNLIRRLIGDLVHVACLDSHIKFINTETLLRSIHDLNEASKAVLKTLPSGRGNHGDPYLKRLINDAQGIYCDASEKKFYTEKAISFMSLFIEYVTKFTRRYIGEDHAASLEKFTQNGNLTEWIRRARKNTIKEEKEWKDKLSKRLPQPPNSG
ncbi:MAG: hypothetical protein P4L87_25620 [Formivibrio sp.]|nr:hypothetical protein [Formivibrio sp.]